MPSPTAESILGGTKARDELSKWTPETRKDKKEKTSKPSVMKESTKKKSPTGLRSGSKREVDDSQPRILVERKELQSLQSERRALFSRIDEAAAEARSLREEVMSREEQVSAARLSSAQQQQVWARHDALRCEERDQARLNAEKAEERARAAGEARASAEADRARLREQLAVSEAESRRAHTEATRSTQQLIAAQAEMAKAQEVHAAAVAQLREELARERERAVAAEARYRELEPERDSSNREVATLSERLTAALSERRTADEAVKQAEEMRDMLREECVHCLSRTRPAWNPTCQLSPPPCLVPPHP